ncbi:uncharacterized protein LOC132951266 [Metopolophium dirhodum]|uniref:uncharacterized protein LOC132951266 n=1 Tax=Metopolophium dirhodum TaxID=44670 RepID=UPI00298F8134|nr:uncharacterized protein LOC132951266 [Metopolophium dirhodum]
MTETANCFLPAPKILPHHSRLVAQRMSCLLYISDVFKNMSNVYEPVTRWENRNLGRKDETTINRLRIGHTSPDHGFLMSKDEHPICEACGARSAQSNISQRNVYCTNIGANKPQLDRNSGRNPWAEPGSKQENPKINQFNRNHYNIK